MEGVPPERSPSLALTLHVRFSHGLNVCSRRATIIFAMGESCAASRSADSQDTRQEFRCATNDQDHRHENNSDGDDGEEGKVPCEEQGKQNGSDCQNEKAS
jgi:hypothetical protein